MSENRNLRCPRPENYPENVTLSHGSGGKMMHQLIEDIFIKVFNSSELRKEHDGAVFDGGGKRYAFTTDSFVIKPLFFPGGNIGSLAVIGTVNDLAMCGAKPFYISVGLIIEEGFSIATLTKIIQSMKEAADETGVEIVTGDTKVVEFGKCDGIYINTSGVGLINHQLDISPKSIRSGDVILVNRDIGCHGMAVMSVREGFQFESSVKSDCASLAETVMTLIDEKIEIKCLRDLTRGGLASGLTELSNSTGLHFSIEEKSLPISREVNSACEILGLDPLLVANEGTFILFVPPSNAEKALNILMQKLNWKNASIIGQVSDDKKKLVTIRTSLGPERIITMPSGEQLPRIC